jgi:hypothetical protein
MKITQACVGHSVRFFKQKFLSRWGLVDYYDVNKPCVFFGGRNLSPLIQKHNSYKIIIPTFPYDVPDTSIVTNREKLFIISPPLSELEPLSTCSPYAPYPAGGGIYYPGEGKIDDVSVYNRATKNITIELKDYSLFKPNVLGDKIYCYTGFINGWNYPWQGDKILELQKNINFEIITTNHQHLSDYHDIDFLKENFYDKCFLNLNFSIEPHGMSTVIEMGLMGRKTILNENYYKFPSILRHLDDAHVVHLINRESKKIGTVQPSMNAHTAGDEWLDTDFWEGE